jgi:hypothetical protein
MVTGTVALAVDVAPAELDEEVEVAARFWNWPGSHVEGAQSFDARTVIIRQKATTQKTRCRDQDPPWGDFMAVVEMIEV